MNLKLPPVNRFLALVACFVFCLGLLPNTAYAVTPQEGWFISGTMERDGINYYIIDNKVNDEKWWVDLSGGVIVLDETFESGYTDTSGNFIGITSGVNSFLYASEGWYGFSGDNDFRIDDDWLIEVSLSSFSGQQGNFSGNPQNISQFTLVAVDRSKIPTISVDYKSMSDGDYGVFDPVFNLDFPPAQMFPYSNLDILSLGPTIYSDQIGSTFYYPASNFMISGVAVNTSSNDIYPTLSEFGIPYSSLDGCDINDLLIFPVSGYIFSGHVEARLAFRFLCPVDKAPAGMAVGDRWPKVWPLEVEMEDAYKEYYDRMFANGQIFEPDDIDTSFGQLDSWKASMDIGLNGVPADGLTFAGMTMGLLGSSLYSWLVWIFVACLILVFINKAVH